MLNSDFITTSSQLETTCQGSREETGEESMSDSCSSNNSYGNENLHLLEEETLLSFNKQSKAVKRTLWKDVELQDVEKLPYDIDGLFAYCLVSPNRKDEDHGRSWTTMEAK